VISIPRQVDRWPPARNAKSIDAHLADATAPRPGLPA
jgi:hypothetical protein